MIKHVLLFGALSCAFTSVLYARDRAADVYSLCASCHGPKGEGNPDIAAPAIAGLPAWYVEAQLKKFQADLRGYHHKDGPGMRMRPMAKALRTEGDVEAMAAYVEKLDAVELGSTQKGNPGAGRNLYMPCIACHGANGKGNKDLNAPPLTALDDWYIVAQLKNFKTGLRAAKAEKDPIGAQMVPMAQMLQDEQAMWDVASYIRTLR